jgi:hypothetical protein
LRTVAPGFRIISLHPITKSATKTFLFPRRDKPATSQQRTFVCADIAAYRLGIPTMAGALDGVELQRIYHHVFLPPQLPQASDDATNVDLQLIDLTLAALGEIQHSFPSVWPDSIGSAVIAIKNLKAVNSFEHGGTRESELLRALHGLLDGQSAPMLIRQQNAAVVVTRQRKRLVFETFELSPSNEAVVSTKGWLTVARWIPFSSSAHSKQMRSVPP